MKIILGLCATSSQHLFQHLETYKQLVDEVVLYDSAASKPQSGSGLSKEELQSIETIFPFFTHIKYQFDGDFSKMRNSLIDYVEMNFGRCWIIMPDDSWSIHGLTRQDFHLATQVNKSILLLKVEDDLHHYICEKVFTSNHRFIGKVRERLDCVDPKQKIIARQGTYFRDLKKNWNRSYTRQPANQPHFQGYHFYQLKQYDIARECLMTALNESHTNSEEKYKCMLCLADIDKNPDWFLKAADTYPARSKEAYYYHWRVTKSFYSLKMAYVSKLGTHYGQVKKDLTKAIYDDYIDYIKQ